MIEQQPTYQKFYELMTFEQQMNCSTEACQLYEFVFNRLRQRDAVEITIKDTEAAQRSKCQPEKLQVVQSEIHRAGLLVIEAVNNRHHQAHEVRTKYVLVEQNA